MGFLSWLGLTADQSPIDRGAAAPDAELFDIEGRGVRLAGLYGPGFTLVYFFPKADTPGCTRQACSLRDDFETLKRRGVEVIGISADTPEAQKRFQGNHHLPFTLLADPARQASKAYGVPLIAGMFRRQSFLIRDGSIAWRDLHAATTEQAADVLKALDQLDSK